MVLFYRNAIITLNLIIMKETYFVGLDTIKVSYLKGNLLIQQRIEDFMDKLRAEFIGPERKAKLTESDLWPEEDFKNE